ncbi:hypothetical protein NEIG_01241 [Nematocida sp. ERTm5]|nr:hypothetical protein NEIG_01241 [Nematocida sp. ERTm5]
MSSSVISELEYMMPELSYYKDRKIFKKEEIEAIVKKRKKFEEILATKPRLSIFLMYIEYEAILERIYKKRSKKIHKKRNYITKRIDSLYKRAQFAFLDMEDLLISHLEYFISVQDKAKIKETAVEIPRKCTGSFKVWIKCADALRSIGEIEGSRILLQRALRVLPSHKKEIIEEYIRLEEDNEENDSPKIIEILKKQIITES